MSERYNPISSSVQVNVDLSGIEGSSGTSGTSGTSGIGTSGTSGIAGTSGTSGKDGFVTGSTAYGEIFETGGSVRSISTSYQGKL